VVEHVRHLRPMGVGDILDETIRLYRQNFRTFVAIAAAPLVPLIILQMIQAAIAGPPLPGQQMPGRDIFDYGSSIVLGILGLLCYVVIEAALTQAISERYLGHQPTVGGAYDVAAACLWRLLRASIRVALLLGLLTVTMHPECIGRGHRMAMLERFIEAAAALDGVVFDRLDRYVDAWATS